MTDDRSSLKAAELLSLAGLAAAGAGGALLLQQWLGPYAVAIFAVGLAVHAAGMWSKHRIEARVQVRTAPWEPILYGLCWFALVALAACLLVPGFAPR
ncbi:hypothetical protein FN976_01875 [Caenimonas sedimenti]|uniref:Uncharacterized protein n=1 Tax=Caenimonas sedimenti TaxID=2596921 RepID=A0A562ZWN5_9BURK|nr:hypothetical protein [Caenimonas sedimenti]TWO73010.1 hypothetical protein FN976_01875 [Caenimonas sedimenti]